MKTIQSSSGITEQSLVLLVERILSSAKEDRVVKVDFSPGDFVSFTQGYVDYDRIAQIPALFPLIEKDFRDGFKDRTVTYDRFAEAYLRSKTRRRFSKVAYNTGQVIYRFEKTL